LFVTGTGTGVGKSVVAAAIIAACAARGEKVAAFKPAVSGLDEATTIWPHDHQLLADATGWQSPDTVSPYLFGPAVSPHLAAAEAGLQITLSGLIDAFDAAAAEADLIVCEGVGGALVPLSDDPDISVLDLAKALALPVVVAARPGLGTISDTRLTVERLAADGLNVAAVVLSGWPELPGAIERSNLETLRRLLPTDVETLPLITPEALASADAGLSVERWLATAD
jgi:dethiobiotin synthetase